MFNEHYCYLFDKKHIENTDTDCDVVNTFRLRIPMNSCVKRYENCISYHCEVIPYLKSMFLIDTKLKKYVSAIHQYFSECGSYKILNLSVQEQNRYLRRIKFTDFTISRLEIRIDDRVFPNKLHNLLHMSMHPRFDTNVNTSKINNNFRTICCRDVTQKEDDTSFLFEPLEEISFYSTGVRLSNIDVLRDNLKVSFKMFYKSKDDDYNHIDKLTTVFDSPEVTLVGTLSFVDMEDEHCSRKEIELTSRLPKLTRRLPGLSVKGI